MSSRLKLSTVHPALQTLFNEVIKHRDCTIVCGERGKEEQNQAFEAGMSKLKWPNSKHNKAPSEAVDVVPYNDGVDYNSLDCCLFAGYVLAKAEALGLRDVIRWGGDWNRNNKITDESFRDLTHFEIV